MLPWHFLYILFKNCHCVCRLFVQYLKNDIPRAVFAIAFFAPDDYYGEKVPDAPGSAPIFCGKERSEYANAHNP